MENSISGVILYDETLRQNAADGTPLVKLIEAAGAFRHQGRHRRKPLPFCPGETITEGLDGLRERLKEYYARRALREVARGDRHRRGHADLDRINANAHALARYAALCQEGGIVPIVEPEVLMDGAHDIDRCAEVTEWMLKTVYQRALRAARRARRHDPEAEHGRSPARSRGEAGLGRGGRGAHRSGAASATCRRPCPASPSCPAANRTRRRQPISTP